MARAHGIDISKWQVTFDASVNPDDIQFVVMRASVGIMADPIFDQLYESIQPVPIRGAYHYFRSEWGWKEQADKFVELVKDTNLHYFALDVETADNVRSKKFCDDAKRWIDYVAKKTGKKVILYTNPIIYSTWLKPYGNWMKNYPLWLAQYWFEPDRDKTPGLPEGVTEWSFWQYSADGNNLGDVYGVGSRSIDLDVFNGTEAELRKFVGAKKGKPKPAAGKITGDLDLNQLARKLAPMVAPLVASQLKRSGGRRPRPGGVSFGIPDLPADHGIPADMDLKALARRLAPMVTPLVEKRLKQRPKPRPRPGGVSFGLPVEDPEPAGVEAVDGIG